MTALNIAELAVQSLLAEAALAPKPGLVTPYSNGSHKDMNFRMFVDSALALFNYFLECASIGESLALLPPEDVFTALHKAGVEGERAMYRVTGGVNTHKGAIYLMGLLCAAAGRLLPCGACFIPLNLARAAASFVSGAVGRELGPLRYEKNRTLTAGERAYLDMGFTGARGEAEGGYALTLSALSFMNSRLVFASFRDAMLDTFFFIAANNRDTNLYARGGADGMRTAWEIFGEILRDGGSASPVGRKKIELAEKLFVEKNLSPGGSADILSCAMFLNGCDYTPQGYDLIT